MNDDEIQTRHHDLSAKITSQSSFSSKTIQRHIQAYITTQLALLSRAQSLLDTWGNDTLVREATMSAADSYRVIREVVSVLDVLQDLHQSRATLDMWLAEHGNALPGQPDLMGAAQAILRLQRTYNLFAFSF